MYEPAEFAVDGAADEAEVGHTDGNVVELHIGHVGEFKEDLLRSDHSNVLALHSGLDVADWRTVDAPEVALHNREEVRQHFALLPVFVDVVIHG